MADVVDVVSRQVEVEVHGSGAGAGYEALCLELLGEW